MVSLDVNCKGVTQGVKLILQNLKFYDPNKCRMNILEGLKGLLMGAEMVLFCHLKNSDELF